MSRETRLNRTIRRALDRRLKDVETKKPPLQKRVVGVLTFLIGVPGIAAALLTLLPRVTVTISDPVDPDNPFSASATVTNTGYIPLRSVMAYVGLGEITTVGSPPRDKNFKPAYWPNFGRPTGRYETLGWTTGLPFP